MISDDRFILSELPVSLPLSTHYLPKCSDYSVGLFPKIIRVKSQSSG